MRFDWRWSNRITYNRPRNSLFELVVTERHRFGLDHACRAGQQNRETEGLVHFSKSVLLGEILDPSARA